MHDRFVITGLEVISPIGSTYELFMNNLYNGVSGIKNITLFNTDSYPYKLAAEISEFDPSQYLEKKGLRYLDRSTTLILSAVSNLIKNSFTARDEEDGENIGVVIGNTFGSLSSISNYDRTMITKGYTFASASLFPNCAKNCPASRISIQHNLMGVNATISNGVASSLNAIDYALNFLSNRRIRMALIGGVEEFSEETFWGFTEAGYSAQGVVLGEGASAFTLETLSSAQENNRRALAEVAGTGVHFASQKLFPQAIRKSVEKALQHSQMQISDVDLVIAHVGGTLQNDLNVIHVLDDLAKEITDPIPFISLKGYLGECYSASGAFQVAAAVGILEQQMIPPVIGVVEPVVSTRFSVPTLKIAKDIQNILLVSADFSGLCVSLILKKSDSE